KRILRRKRLAASFNSLRLGCPFLQVQGICQVCQHTRQLIMVGAQPALEELEFGPEGSLGISEPLELPVGKGQVAQDRQQHIVVGGQERSAKRRQDVQNFVGVALRCNGYLFLFEEQVPIAVQQVVNRSELLPAQLNRAWSARFVIDGTHF